MQALLGLALAPAAVSAAFAKVAAWDVKEPAALSIAQDLPGSRGQSAGHTQSTQSGKPRWLTLLSNACLIHIVHDMTLQKLLKTRVLM